jgi:chemotaxis methyl-accepting protein methylase
VERLPDNIRKKYFNNSGKGYEVADDIRQALCFSRFDLTSSGRQPFMNLDIIFCCNFLIYLQKNLQEKVIDMLYNSLSSRGYLVLGEAETLPNGFRDKLLCLDKKARLYRKIEFNL